MKNFETKLRIWEAAALWTICLVLLGATWAQARQNAISSELVRLHVIAVSDEEREQQIKLKVRDSVLSCLRPVLSGTENREDAEKLIRLHMPEIKAAAEAASEGRAVSVSLGRESYPTKKYLGFSLPAGNYDSLKITLGEGRGHNWWCIVFPPLCLDASQAQQVQSVMARDDFELVSGNGEYKLKFRAVELWGEFLNKVAG